MWSTELQDQPGQGDPVRTGGACSGRNVTRDDPRIGDSGRNADCDHGTVSTRIVIGQRCI